MTTFEPIFDHRARIEKLQMEAAARRERALVDQRSPGISHDARVRIWERLHQVRLPNDPAHPILARIAQMTGLELAEVLEVQRSRLPQADGALKEGPDHAHGPPGGGMGGMDT